MKMTEKHWIVKCEYRNKNAGYKRREINRGEALFIRHLRSSILYLQMVNLH